MNKKIFNKFTILSITLFFITIAVSTAFEGKMSQRGYNYFPSVIINWYSVDQETSSKQVVKNIEKKKSVEKIHYQDLNFSIAKTIIIDSSTVKKKPNQDYVIVQHTSKEPSFVSNSYTLTAKDAMEEKKPKTIIKTAQKVMIDKLIEMRVQKKYPPTQNIVVEEQRFADANKNKKNKKIQLVSKEMIPVNFDKFRKLEEKKEEPASQVKVKINDQYAVVGNPFDNVFDSPSNTESLSELKVKKTKAPSYNPLIRFPLSEYTVKGVITSDQGNRALITTSKGNYFYIKEGEFIGANKGVVDEINNNSIVILERDRKVEIIISSDGRVSSR